MAEDMRINCARTLDHCYSLETCEHMCEAARWVEFLLELDVIHELQFPTSSLADTQPNAISMIFWQLARPSLGLGLLPSLGTDHQGFSANRDQIS